MRAVLVPAFATGILLGGCNAEKHDAVEPARPVVSVVATAHNPEQERFAGLVDAQTKIGLSFLTLGRMVSRSVDVGDLVQPGQRVAALDPVALEQAVRIAQSGLASAQAVLATASSTQGRSQSLHQSGVTTQAALDAADEAVQAARSSVLQAQAELTKAKEQLSYASLSSTISGVVTSVSAEVGQVVLAGQAIMTVAQPEMRDAVVDVPEAIGKALTVGTPFVVALELDKAITTPGRVREITPFANPTTRTHRIKIALADAPTSFRLGSSVIATLPAANAAPAIVLPVSALLERDGKTSVWVVDAATGTVAPREIVVAERRAADFTVKSGVKPGERIVAAGVHSLASGQRITLDSPAK